MPLIKYSQFLTFPDGNPVDTLPYPVMRLGGNVLIPTFTDKAGTTPLANPVLTDAEGLLTFYAAPGAYVTDVSGRLFQYVVDDDETDVASKALITGHPPSIEKGSFAMRVPIAPLTIGTSVSCGAFSQTSRV